MRQVVNILFLGGAKRVAMGRLFIEAGRRLGMEVVLFSYELSTEVPVSEVSRVIVGRRWNDHALMEDLHEVVTENRIDIIIPFVDPAVEIAARYCMSDPSVWTPFKDGVLAAHMFDKCKADELFRNIGVPVPRNAGLEKITGEVIAKPRHGSASKGIRVMENDEYAAMRSRGETDGYIFQEYISDREEYTVDCYVASDGKVICAVPRRRLEVAGGEVVSTVTVADKDIAAISRNVLEGLSLRGAVTIQFLRDRTDGRLMIMELNPRLGGGAVCAVYAGADIPAFILTDWRDGKVPVCDDWQAGVKTCRYFEDVVFKPGKDA